MNESELYEIAERYLSGELEDAERDQVDDRLEQDDAFSQDFAKYLVMKQLAKEAAEEEWRKDLLLHYDEEDSQGVRKTVSIKRWRWLSAVAAILLLGVIAYLFRPQPPRSPFAEEVSQVYKEKIYDQKERSSSDKYIEFFKNNHLEKALVEAQKQEEAANLGDKPTWIERQGFCYWAQGEWQKALVVFQKLEENKVYLPESNPAKWYQALTYLGMGEMEKCKDRLNELINSPKHDFQSDARRLLGKI